MSNEKAVSKTKVVTSEVRLSYVNVWEPKKAPGSTEAKYSVCIMIPKKNKALLAKINEAIDAAKIDGKENKWKGKIPANLKLPLRDGDEERDGEEFNDMMFINASGKRKPGIIDASGNEIIERDEFYSGVYAKAAINFYAFSTNGSNGVACGLNNLMKTKDGENLSGGSSAQEDFKDEIDNDDI